MEAYSCFCNVCFIFHFDISKKVQKVFKKEHSFEKV